MNALQAAEKYVRRGFAVVPVPAGKKGPVLEGWEALRLTTDELSQHFNSKPQNVGLILGLPSGWLVNVDLDVSEAVAVAGRFLPLTLTSGHGHVLDLHWWYFAEGVETKVFHDTDGKKRLIELRAGGCHTVVAPSVHPDGSKYAWASSGLEIARVEAVKLKEAVNKLATATLIAWHLPDHRKLGGGGRHDFALALAGFMLRNDRLDAETVLAILRAAWDARAWPSEQDRREAHRDLEGAVEDTVHKLRQDKQVKGGRKLDEMEPGLPDRIADYWGWSARSEAPLEEKEERRNQADRLIEYAREDASLFFVDQNGEPHALVRRDPIPLNSRSYSWLRKLLFDNEQRSCTAEALRAAVGTLAAFAEFSGEAIELHTRSAFHDGVIYYELGPGRVWRIGPDGHHRVDDPPVLFRRYANLKELPDPEEGADLQDLAGFVNLKTSRDRRLFITATATAPLPHIARPIINTTGPMGSGKTTIARLMKRLLDPTVPEFVRVAYRDFLQKAMHSYIVVLDNQSILNDEAVDTLCRLVTGEADSKRRLYTDDEDVIYQLRRMVVSNAINPPSDRADFNDRSLPLELERISDTNRRDEEEMWELFEAHHGKLLGAVFDVLSKVLKKRSEVKLSRKPHLADWAGYAAAVYEVRGWEEDGKKGAELFLKDWGGVVKAQNRATLDASSVALAIIEFMKEEEEHAAQATVLYEELKKAAQSVQIDIERDKSWPKDVRWLWRRVKEVIPALLALGIEATRRDTKEGTEITLRKKRKNDSTDSTAEENPVHKGNAGGDKGESDSTDDSTKKPDKYAGSGNSGDSGNIFASSSGSGSGWWPRETGRPSA